MEGSREGRKRSRKGKEERRYLPGCLPRPPVIKRCSCPSLFFCAFRIERERERKKKRKRKRELVRRKIDTYWLIQQTTINL